MLEALINEANLTRTENGALAYRSTKSECLQEVMKDIQQLLYPTSAA